MKITATDVLELEAPVGVPWRIATLREILVPALPEPVGGTIEVPQRPGLGFELDEAKVAEFRRV